MLEIASIIFVVVAVLFGICLTVFIKSYRSYSSDNGDGSPEKVKEPKRRKKPVEDKVTPENTAPEDRRPRHTKPASEQKAEPEPKAEPVEGPKTEQPAVAETPSPEKKDISATMTASEADMIKLREAAKAASESRPVRRAEPVIVPQAPQAAEEDTDDDSSGSKLVPIVVATASVIAVICIAALAYVFVVDRKEPVNITPSTITATVQDIQLRKTYTGKISSPDNITAMFAATGEITEVMILEGDHVAKDDVIYTIDDTNIKARIDLLNERLESLSSGRTESKRTAISAPASGTVTSVRVSSGDKVGGSTAIAEITSPAEHRVTVTLDSQVRTGTSVNVSTNGITVKGTVSSVTQISPAPADEESGDENSDENTDDNTNEPGNNNREPEPPKAAWSAVISFTTSGEVGSTANVTVNGQTASGNVTRGRSSTVSVYAGSAGTLTSLRISEGDRVDEGDTVAYVETQTQTGDGNDFDERELKLEIEQLTSELENYTVKASVDGYVQKLFLKRGDNAAVGMSAVTIVPSDGLLMTVALDAETAESLAVPRQARFRLRRTGKFNDDVWDKLDLDSDYISTMETIVPAVDGDGYTGYILLEDPSLFRDGMTAQVTLVTYTAYNAVTVPQELVKDDKIKLLTDSGEIIEIQVATGVTTDDGYLEILGGLTVSDRILKDQEG